MNPKPPSPPPAQQAWNSLWATGVVDTFGHSGDGEGSPLSTQWRQWFARLPAGCRVLDLGTGNGALPRLLVQAGGASVDAVDVAQPRPQWVESLSAADRQRVRFHAGVRCEALPFEDASFDCVVSQFGIEYTDLDTALPEALRVLKPGGMLRCVIHHVAARPATLAREEITHARWLVDSGWLESARDMSTAMAMISKPGGREKLNTEPRWQAIRSRFDGFQQQLAERAGNSTCPDLLADAQGWLPQVFQAAAKRGDDAAQAGMDEVTRLLKEGELRLQDLVDHALDEQRMRQVSELIERAGRKALTEPAEDAGHLMGWWLTALPRTAPAHDR